MLKRFAERASGVRARRAGRSVRQSSQVVCNEPLEPRLLLCGLNHVVITEAQMAQLRAGAPTSATSMMFGEPLSGGAAGPVFAAPAAASVAPAASQFPEIRWINRGSSSNDSDGFNSVYGASAPIARRVIDGALISWERVFRDFNNEHNNVIEVVFNMDSDGVSQGAAASNTGITDGGVPYSGAVTIGRGLDADG